MNTSLTEGRGKIKANVHRGIVFYVSKISDQRHVFYVKSYLKLEQLFSLVCVCTPDWRHCDSRL